MSSSYTVSENAKPRSLNCKTYTPPPKSSATLSNLSNPSLPEDVIDIIARFEKEAAVHCNPCELVNFNTKFFQKCSSPSTPEQFLKVQEELKEEGSTCEVGVRWEKHYGQGPRALQHTLQTCMEGNSYHDTPKLQNQQMFDSRKPSFISCQIESERETQLFIKKKQEEILGLQRAIDLPGGDESRSRESEGDAQSFIREQEATLFDLQTIVESHRQDMIYNRHIFEGL